MVAGLRGGLGRGRRSPHAAVSVAGQQHGMVALDDDRRAIRPAKLWNDTESAPEAVWLIGRLPGGQAWADACGLVPVASFTITKLAASPSRAPGGERLAHVVLPHDWLTLQLTGGSSPTGATPRAPATGRRRAARTGTTCSRS